MPSPPPPITFSTLSAEEIELLGGRVFVLDIEHGGLSCRNMDLGGCEAMILQGHRNAGLGSRQLRAGDGHRHQKK